MPRSVLLITAAFSMTACATSYAPLYSPTEVARVAESHAISNGVTDFSLLRSPALAACEAGGQSVDRLAQTLGCAEILQGIYSSGYRNASNWNDAATLLTIGGAGGAAWILVNGKKNSVKKAAKVGIGVGILSALRDQFFPDALPTTFIKGHAALGCVIAQRDYFKGSAADSIHDSLKSSLEAVQTTAIALATLRYTSPNPAATKTEDEQLKAAQAVADQAIAFADDQLETSGGQLLAFEFANSTFVKAVTDIGAWVASRGRAHADFSYQDFVQKYAPSTSGGGAAKPIVAPAIAAAPSLTAAELLTQLSKTTQELIIETRELKASTPDYKAQLATVAQCATALPTT